LNRITVSRASETGSDAELARVSDVVPNDARSSDTLVMGSTISQKEEIAYELLADSWATDSAPFVITATDPMTEFRSRYRPYVPGDRSVEDVYVIDCLNMGASDDTGSNGCSLSSPADLTGIGICLSKGYESHGAPGGRKLLLDNLATLLIYTDLERVYRFVSTINTRVGEMGDSTVQLLDSDSLEGPDRHKFYNLFPTVVEVKTTSDRTLFRVRGRSQTPWYEYQPARGDM
jgi:hypothetical protein